MEIFSVKSIFHVGGFTMYILFFCSIIVFAVILERIYIFLKFSNEFKIFKENFGKNQNIDIPIFSSLILKINFSDKINELQKEKIHLMNMSRISSYLDKNLPVLATIGAMAPFIGLFGTVLGIIKAFKQLSIHRGAGIDVVGAGIAEALVCTAAGLFVAIVSVIFYNFFKTKIKRIVDEFDIEETNYLADIKNEEEV